MTYHLYHGDCLGILPTLDPKSVNLILTDPPYGCLSKKGCPWDCPIDLDQLWQAYDHLLPPDGVVVLFADLRLAAQLLTTATPNIPYRYNLVWAKTIPTRYLDANRIPLPIHEHLLVFSRRGNGYGKYRPQMTTGAPYVRTRHGSSACYADHDRIPTINTGDRYPTSILTFGKTREDKGRHTTQKPLALLRHLIRTYTDPGDHVLDHCFGSGSTGIASLAENRVFTGIEKDPVFFAQGKEWLDQFSDRKNSYQFSCN